MIHPNWNSDSSFEDEVYQPSGRKYLRLEQEINEPESVVVHTQATIGPPNNNLHETRVNINSEDRPLLLKQKGRQQWCKIDFGSRKQCDGLYKLGKIVLQLISQETQLNANSKLTSDFNNNSIGDRFPGLETFRIQVEGITPSSTNTVQLVTRREISKENAAAFIMPCKINKRPPPKNCKYIEFKHFTYTFRKLNLPPAFFEKPGKLGTRKIFKIEFEKYDSLHSEITLQANLYSSIIKGDPYYVEASAPDMTDAIPVFDYYFRNTRKESGINTSLTHRGSSDDAQRFFSLMREYHSFEIRPTPDYTVQDDRLIPQLLDYQKEAVSWMLFREGVLEFSDEDNESTQQLQSVLSKHMNTLARLSKFGNKGLPDAYYSQASGCISWEKQKIDKLATTGGILADEMGLGKTIEMISLILLNTRRVTDLASPIRLHWNSTDDEFDVKYYLLNALVDLGLKKTKKLLLAVNAAILSILIVLVLMNPAGCKFQMNICVHIAFKICEAMFKCFRRSTYSIILLCLSYIWLQTAAQYSSRLLTNEFH